MSAPTSRRTSAHAGSELPAAPLLHNMIGGIINLMKDKGITIEVAGKVSSESSWVKKLTAAGSCKSACMWLWVPQMYDN